MPPAENYLLAQIKNKNKTKQVILSKCLWKKNAVFS